MRVLQLALWLALLSQSACVHHCWYGREFIVHGTDRHVCLDP